MSENAQMDFVKTMQELAACSICMHYMVGDRRPMGFGCGHIICKSCMVTYSRFPCPECRKISDAFHNGNNHPQPIYQMESMCEAVAKYAGPVKTMCSECEKELNKEEVICMKCRKAGKVEKTVNNPEDTKPEVDKKVPPIYIPRLLLRLCEKAAGEKPTTTVTSENKKSTTEPIIDLTGDDDEK